MIAKVSIPDGDSFLREVNRAGKCGLKRRVSIPDGDSFLREVPPPLTAFQFQILFQSPMGIVSSAKSLVR